MQQDFEWLRVSLAIGLMGFAFFLLPAFFLWKDRRDDEREAARVDQYAARGVEREGQQ